MVFAIETHLTFAELGVGDPAPQWRCSMAETPSSRMFEFVSSCDDPEKLRTIVRNARKRGADALADAAFRKLVSILPSEEPGTVEHDFWRTIHSFEHVLTEERG